MRLIIKALMLSTFFVLGAVASEPVHDVSVFVSENSDGKITPTQIQKVLEEAGFMVEANNNMNAPYKRDFNETSFDVYNLMVIWRKDTVMALAKDFPEVGLYAPMTASIYTKKGDKSISVAYLSMPALAKIIGAPADNPAIIDLGKKLNEALKKAMPNGKYVPLNYKMQESKKDFVTRVSFELEGDDWEDAKDDFQMAFESELATNKFVMAAFADLNYDLEENDKEWYDFYDVYSICKIEVIYEVSKNHPEAGAFAPCSAYMYQKKGEKTVHMAFPNVYKWMAALNIKDQKALDTLLDAQKRFETMIKTTSKK